MKHFQYVPYVPDTEDRAESKTGVVPVFLKQSRGDGRRTGEVHIEV